MSLTNIANYWQVCEWATYIDVYGEKEINVF
jgi:hypothetical protein